MPAKTSELIERYRVTKGRKFRLRDTDPGDTGGVDAQTAKALLERGVEELADLQEKLYAENRWALLVIFQAMDAAGKDSAIEHVMSGVNPQGCQVYSFKEPSREELSHDFLWRASKVLPQRGHIGIFNRSYYEEVLVVRVHEELLQNARLPPRLVTRHIWRERYQDINGFERHLLRNGVVILKFFLHVSKDEQKRRFLERIDNPRKNWKFSLTDARERARWDDYMDAYERMVRNTASKHAPWLVVPADAKWYTRMIVAAALVDALKQLDPAFPKLEPQAHKELAAARALLTGSRPKKTGARSA